MPAHTDGVSAPLRLTCRHPNKYASGWVQGPQAHKAGVIFPKDQAALDRTLLVGNLNPSVTDEQARNHPLLHLTDSVITWSL